MKTVAIIQARMSSSRLPGKVLQQISGKPMLAHVVERARRARLVDMVCVATTTDPSDDPIATLCREQDIPCQRGSMHDVLDRYYQAAQVTQAETIVRLTADCPLLEPAIVDATITAFLGHADFAANRLPPPWTRSFPIGLDVEVCNYAALARAWAEALRPYHREHVMPYLYEGVSFESGTVHPESGGSYVCRGTSQHGFRIAQLHHIPNYGSQRWTVDTAEDLELVRVIFSHFESEPYFNWYDVVALMEREPDLARINASVQHKTAYDVDTRTNQ